MCCISLCLCAAPSKILTSRFVLVLFFLTAFLPLSWYLLCWSQMLFLPLTVIRSVSCYFSLFWQQCQKYIVSTSNHVVITVIILISIFSLCHLACDKFKFLVHWLLQAEPKVNNLCINLCLLNNLCIWCRTTLLLLKQP